MQSWDLDEKTGDYKMSGGAPVETDSLRVPAYLRLKIRRQGWMYAPDTAYGSDFWQIKKRQSTRDSTSIENAAARALQPIANDGRASSFTIDTDAVARNGVGLKIKIVEASGELDQLNLQSLGV